MSTSFFMSYQMMNYEHLKLDLYSESTNVDRSLSVRFNLQTYTISIRYQNNKHYLTQRNFFPSCTIKEQLWSHSKCPKCTNNEILEQKWARCRLGDDSCPYLRQSFTAGQGSPERNSASFKVMTLCTDSGGNSRQNICLGPGCINNIKD